MLTERKTLEGITETESLQRVVGAELSDKSTLVEEAKLMGSKPYKFVIVEPALPDMSATTFTVTLWGTCPLDALYVAMHKTVRTTN